MAIDVKITFNNENITNIPSQVNDYDRLVINNKYILFYDSSYPQGSYYMYRLNNLQVRELIFNKENINLLTIALVEDVFYYTDANDNDKLKEINLITKEEKEYVQENFVQTMSYSNYLPNIKYLSYYGTNETNKIRYTHIENNAIKYDDLNYDDTRFTYCSLEPQLFYNIVQDSDGNDRTLEIFGENIHVSYTLPSSLLFTNFFANWGIDSYIYFLFLGVEINYTYHAYILKYNVNDITTGSSPVEIKDYILPINMLLVSVFFLNNKNLVAFNSSDKSTYTFSITDTEEIDNYNITLKFDSDVVETYTKTTDIILKAVKISLLGGSIVARIKYSKGDDDFISTSGYPNSYKYATSVTIGENTYNLVDNEVEVNDLNISGDVEIKLNNGVIAYYDITFKNDTKLLQIKRTEENTLPVYEGETPTQEGKVFVGWTPEIYSVNKAQIYKATFEQAPFTITIADSGNKDFSVYWWDTLSDEKSREFSKPIVSIGSTLNASPYDNTFFLVLKTGDETGYMCTIGYTEKNVIPQQLKIGQSTYDIGTNNDINIESNTTINIVANTRSFIRFLNYDDSILETKYVYEGDTPTYTGDTPYRKGYNFTGWSPTLYPANKNQDYVAQFSKQSFTIRFLDDDGSELETKQVEYGVTPTYTGTTPTKEGYTFNGWSPTLYPANKNQDYTATYRNNAFALTLYKNSAENNRIDKTEYLTSVGEITGYLRNETNIINPSIVIEYTGVINFNYVYISTFNRYYFVTNITSVRTNLWRLDMSCDVLMTYKETILNYECYVSRNENDYNPDIEDNYLPLEYEKVVEVTNLYDDTYNFGKIFLESNYSVVFTTIYKGSEYEVLDEQVESEFQDLEGNILEVSSISLGASNYKCIGIIKNNILDNLNKLVEKTINDDTLASYIISLIVFPIKGSDLSFSTLNPSKLLIKDDSTSITVAQDDVSYPRGGVLTPVIANQFTIKPKYNNFLDYEPYTTYEIYLPFYGWLKLNSYQILNQQLVVNYVPQVDSEQCTIIISKGAVVGGSKEVIAEVTCQLGIQIPINSTNVERINREKTANTLNSIVGTISGVAVAGAGAVTGNPLAVVGGASMAIGSLTSGLSKNMTMLPSAQSKTGSSYDGAVGDRTFKLRITYPKIAVDDISKYAKYIGRPLQTNVKLNTLTGYTIVGGVHIENLDTATDNEKTDIENQLRKGVII